MLNKRFFILSALIVLIFYLTFVYYDYKDYCLEEQLWAANSSLESATARHNAAYNAVCDDNTDLKNKLDKANQTIADLTGDEYELVYLGDFKITYYCDESREHICGHGNNMTASGKPTEVGWSAAADWGVLPNGSIVYINGIGWREICDVGGSVNGKHIDVLVSDHSTALQLGVGTENVWILVKKS